MRPLLVFLLCALSPGIAAAASSFEIDGVREKHHVTADRTLYHSNEKVYEAFGHVVVSSRGQRLAADYLLVDDNTKELKARGNVIFVDQQITVQAAEIHFNLETGIGSIFYGKVFNDRYSLRGQLIRRVSENRFLTTEGEYTTCKDCAESWKLAAQNVDLTVEGYAFLESVYIKIKDVPTLYIPYAVVPVKTKRQTGLLFPRMGASSSHGFIFMQPLFVAIDDHQDLTISAGKYSGRGNRLELEYRYMSYNGIMGQFNGYFTRDRRPESPRQDRRAFQTEHKWPISKVFGMRLRATEVLDRDYVRDFPEDIQAKDLPAIESNLVTNSPFRDFFISAEARRYRNLVYDTAVGFDGGMVQAAPTVHVGVKERGLLGPLMGSVYGRYDRFDRRNGPFNDINGNGFFDPKFGDTTRTPELVREADRFVFQPELSAPFRVGRILQLGPSVQYNDIRYRFSVPISPNASLPKTSTRYVQTRLEASTVIEKVYDYDGEKVSRVKHQLSPFITGSYIPWFVQDQQHPFQQQLRERQEGLFDQFDIVPRTNTTSFQRYPQGKSIYYGFNSRVVRKMKRESEMPRAYPYDLLPASKPRKYPPALNRKQELFNEAERLWEQHNPRYDDYQEVWHFSVAQAYDFIDAKHQADKKRAFSFLLAKSQLTLDQLGHWLEYRFFPRIVKQAESNSPEELYSNMHSISTGLTWNLVHRTNLRKTRSFTRSIGLTFVNASRPYQSRSVGSSLIWSLNDFVNFKIAYTYDLLLHNQLDWSAVTTFTHASECWGLVMRYDWLGARRPNKGDVGVELLLNLMGTGFLGAGGTTQGEGGGRGVFGN